MFLSVENAYDFMANFEGCKEDGKVYTTIRDLENLSNEKLLEKMPAALSDSHFYKSCYILKVAPNVENLVKEMQGEILEAEGEKYYAFNLAPALGLPNKKATEELEELKEFLLFLKNKSIEHNNREIHISLGRWFEDANLGFYCDDSALELEINSFVEEKINNSSTLQQWVKNLKEGIMKTHPHLDNLYCNMSASDLMNPKEMMANLDSTEKVNEKNKKLTCAEKKAKRKF